MPHHDHDNSPPAEETESSADGPRSEDGLEYSEQLVDADEDGLEHVQINIRKVLTNKRLDKYLSGRLGKVSRAALQRYIKDGDVRVNGQVVKPSYTIRAGDTIDMMLPEQKAPEITPEPIPIDVVYEDGDLLAINKQPDIIVHPARGNWSGTLVNALAYYFQQNWREGAIKELPTTGEPCRPGIVHRLDRDTTGIMLVAKTELAIWRLGHQFEHRKIQKTYTAIVHGLVELDEDVIDSPIGKHPVIKEKYAVDRRTGKPFGPTTKEAVTRYKVIERIPGVGKAGLNFTLVECYPKTGRTHQLRVHMSGLGYPMVGDRLYGGGPIYISQLEGRADVAEGPLITRQALHAHTIEFNHPRSDDRMKLEAPLPEDFTRTLEELRTRSGSS